MTEAGGSYPESVGNKNQACPLALHPSHPITTATHPHIGADVGINGVTRDVAFKETEEELLCQDLGCTGDRSWNRRAPGPAHSYDITDS